MSSNTPQTEPAPNKYIHDIFAGSHGERKLEEIIPIIVPRSLVQTWRVLAKLQAPGHKIYAGKETVARLRGVLVRRIEQDYQRFEELGLMEKYTELVKLPHSDGFITKPVTVKDFTKLYDLAVTYINWHNDPLYIPPQRDEAENIKKLPREKYQLVRLFYKYRYVLDTQKPGRNSGNRGNNTNIPKNSFNISTLDRNSGNSNLYSIENSNSQHISESLLNENSISDFEEEGVRTLVPDLTDKQFTNFVKLVRAIVAADYKQPTKQISDSHRLQSTEIDTDDYTSLYEYEQTNEQGGDYHTPPIESYPAFDESGAKQPNGDDTQGYAESIGKGPGPGQKNNAESIDQTNISKKQKRNLAILAKAARDQLPEIPPECERLTSDMLTQFHDQAPVSTRTQLRKLLALMLATGQTTADFDHWLKWLWDEVKGKSNITARINGKVHRMPYCNSCIKNKRRELQALLQVQKEMQQNGNTNYVKRESNPYTGSRHGKENKHQVTIAKNQRYIHDLGVSMEGGVTFSSNQIHGNQEDQSKAQENTALGMGKVCALQPNQHADDSDDQIRSHTSARGDQRIPDWSKVSHHDYARSGEGRGQFSSRRDTLRTTDQNVNEGCTASLSQSGTGSHPNITDVRSELPTIDYRSSGRTDYQWQDETGGYYTSEDYTGIDGMVGDGDQRGIPAIAGYDQRSDMSPIQQWRSDYTDAFEQVRDDDDQTLLNEPEPTDSSTVATMATRDAIAYDDDQGYPEWLKTANNNRRKRRKGIMYHDEKILEQENDFYYTGQSVVRQANKVEDGVRVDAASQVNHARESKSPVARRTTIAREIINDSGIEEMAKTEFTISHPAMSCKKCSGIIFYHLQGQNGNRVRNCAYCQPSKSWDQATRKHLLSVINSIPSLEQVAEMQEQEGK